MAIIPAGGADPVVELAVTVVAAVAAGGVVADVEVDAESEHAAAVIATAATRTGTAWVRIGRRLGEWNVIPEHTHDERVPLKKLV